ATTYGNNVRNSQHPDTQHPDTQRPDTQHHVQASFDELGRSLYDVTFCVVDLETTGGSAARGAKITEIGAVKLRGGEVIGAFSSLIDPGVPIPGFITVLTGITDDMVFGASDMSTVLTSYCDFAYDYMLM